MLKAITLSDRVADEASPVVVPVPLAGRPSTEPEVTRLRDLVDLLGAALHLADQEVTAR